MSAPRARQRLSGRQKTVDNSFTVLAADLLSGTITSGAAKGVTLEIVEHRCTSYMGGQAEKPCPVDIGDKAK